MTSDDDDGAVPASTVAGSPAPSTSAPAGPDQAVTIINFAFDPPDLTVPAGATLTWTNDDDVAHNVLSPDEVIASPDLARNDTYEVTLDQEGTIEYQCDIHQYMRGTITVTP